MMPFSRRIPRLSLSTAVAAVFLLAAVPTWAGDLSPAAAVVNRGVVEVETAGGGYGAIQLAEEIGGVVNDGATRRVLPVVARGPMQEILDLKYLRGIDLAIIQSDALDYARGQAQTPGLANLTFIAKLYNDELHLLVRSDIKTIKDLTNQTVNFGERDSGSAFTGGWVFNLLQLPVTTANDSQQVALEKLRAGTIAGMVFLTAKPAPLMSTIGANDGLHLLSIPMTTPVTAAYIPTRILQTDYPNLVPADQAIDTVAVSNILVAADLRVLPERYNNVANAVEALFTGFQTLREGGHQPKWREVNLAADLPGWQRHPQAAQWLQRNSQVNVAAVDPEAMKAMFARFVDERRQASGNKPMSLDEKAALFQQFTDWQRGQAR